MKTIQDWHAELQQNFMKIVNKMVESNCALPDDFTLFYKLKEEHDRYGVHITIVPFLTKELALDSCPKDDYEKKNDDENIVYQTSSAGKYGGGTIYKIIDGKCGSRKHIACCDIESHY